jgi:hypothetical protein
MSNKNKTEDQSTAATAGRLKRVVSKLGIDGWQGLLALAEEICPPDNLPEGSPDWWSDVVFKTATGWTVVIFYDGDELDYIDHFTTPDGQEIDFWDWPEEDEWKKYLINWRGVGDLERLMSC